MLWVGFSGVRAVKEAQHRANDFSTYHLRSADIASGLDPYRVTEGQAPYIYPPLLLWLFTPLTMLPMPAAAVVWAMFSLAATLLIVALVASLPGLATPPALIGFFITFRFLMREISQGQVNAIVVAGTVLALALLLRNRDVLAGLTLALVTTIKILPASFLLPLVLWRRWRAAGAMLAAIPLFLFLPVLTWGPSTTARTIEQWRGGQLLSHAQDLALDTQAQNVSLWAWCRRTFSKVPATPPGKPVRMVNVTELSPGATTAIYGLFAMILLSCSIRALAGAREPAAMVAGWALTWNLVHLISKKSWEEHLVSLILILAVLAARPGRRWTWMLPAMLLWCHAPLLVGSGNADLIQLLSPTTVALTITFTGLIIRLEHTRTGDPAPEAPR